MENKEKKLIAKILLIIGVVFCGLSQLVPWTGLGGYTWGFSFFGQTSIFYIDFFGYGGFGILMAISMIVTFILCIVALILGILAIKNVELQKSKTSLYAAIVSLAAVIFVAVALSVGTSMMTAIMTGGLVTMAWGFSTGFYMMITPIVTFFAAYGIQRTMAYAPTPAMTQPMYQQPMQTQAPAQYYAQQPQTPPPPPAQTTPPPPQPQAPPPTQPTAVPPQTAAKFCPDCGAKLEGKPKFCNKCGNKLA